jgi:hypothetical protein
VLTARILGFSRLQLIGGKAMSGQGNQQAQQGQQQSQQQNRPPLKTTTHPLPWVAQPGQMTTQQAFKLSKQAATAQFLDVIGTHIAHVHLEQTQQIASQMLGQPVYTGNVSSITGSQDQPNGRGRTSAAE